MRKNIFLFIKKLGGDFFENPLGLELDQQRPWPNLPFAKGRLTDKKTLTIINATPLIQTNKHYMTIGAWL
jgi:hypothetical protein